VELILDLLGKTEGKVTLLTVGTERDIAAAYNRNPGLFRKKVSRIYLNAGIYGFPDGRFDVNLNKDRNAFIVIMRSGLPVYWAPCFGENNYETFWQADQGKLLKHAAAKLQNYFLYAFSKGTGKIGPTAGQAITDPLEFLKRPVDPDELGKVYGASRNMWSTASILDAAGLKIYRNKQGEYTASRRRSGNFMQEVTPYSFKKMKLFIDDHGRVDPGKPGNTEVFVFHKNDVDEYRNALESILKKMFGGL
jgi:pyrimidine-specific ribonucleoside hydrolase